MTRALVILTTAVAILVGAGFAWLQAGHCLDLGRGRGHGEALYPEALPLRSLDFEARFSDDSYVIAFFNRDSEGFAGVRFSRSPLLDSVYFEASPEGRFLRKEPIPFDPGAGGSEARLRVALGDAEVRIFQEGKLLRTVAARLKQNQGFGFRGGERPVQVDSVRIELKDGTSLQWKDRWSAWAVLSREPAEHHRPRYFPGLHVDKLEALAGGQFRDLSFRGKGIRDPRRIPSKGPYKILFTGTSQTLGEGADRPEDRWTERFVRALRETFGQGLRIEADVAAMSLAEARDLIGPLQARLSRERFDLVIVNLSCLDYQRLSFLRSLETIASTAQGQGADVLFILEPMSVEADDLLLRSMHRLMLSVAAGKGIPALDLHYRLSAQGRYDSGLVWRDYVSPASLGQRMFSDALTDYFMGLLR